MHTRLRICLPVVIGLAALLPTMVAVAQTAETPQEYIQRLIKEAVGAQPVRQSRISRQRKVDNALRGWFHAMILQNRDFAQAEGKMDKNKIKQLMTAESFVDPAVADADLQELHNYVALEQDNGEKTDKIIADLHHTLETADWAEAQRKQILSSFEVLVERPQDDRRHYLRAERQWADAVDDAYKYVGEHRKDIKMQDESLKVFDDKVLDELNRRIRAVNARREEMVAAMQTYKTMQNKRLEELGIHRGDVGLP